jgi:hypothetical protein
MKTRSCRFDPVDLGSVKPSRASLTKRGIRSKFKGLTADDVLASTTVNDKAQEVYT